MLDKLQVPDSIYFGDIEKQFSTWIKSTSYTSYFILVDSSSSVYCLPDLIQINPNINWNVIEIPMGEEYKTIMTCSLIWEELLNKGADRQSLLVNLGGGVIGDMGGFAAGTYMRGIDFVQIPTTLLAMVDASVGGKVAVDFRLAKNIIGLFQNPKANFIDSKWLTTLSKEEKLSGWGEIIKHAIIADSDAFRKIQKFYSFHEVDFDFWILHSIAIKHKIVESDPKEQGLRKGLNFGHTIGHAVESYFLAQSEPKKHGECVAIGMVCATFISQKMVELSHEDTRDIVQVVKKWFRPIEIPMEGFDDILARMSKDKKNIGGQVNFTLIPKIGEYVFNKIPSKELILAAMKFYNEEMLQLD